MERTKFKVARFSVQSHVLLSVCQFVNITYPCDYYFINCATQEYPYLGESGWDKDQKLWPNVGPSLELFTVMH